MRRVYAALAALALVVVLVPRPGSISAVWTCPESGNSSECVHPAGGSGSGTVLRPTDAVLPDNGLSVYSYVGAVCSSCSWPFTRGSGWNGRYSNRDVYQIKLGNGSSSYCLDAKWSNTGVVAATCEYGGQSSLWVRSGRWLISVHDTDARAASSTWRPWALTASCLSSGCKVVAGRGGTWSYAKQNWGLLHVLF